MADSIRVFHTSHSPINSLFSQSRTSLGYRVAKSQIYPMSMDPGMTLPSKDFDNFLPYPLSFRVESHIGLRGSQSPQSTEWWKEDQKVFSEGSLMEDGNSHRLERDCRLELGWEWEDGREKLREEVMDFIKSLIWLSGSCAQTYLICSVVKSMEAQVPLGKCRCWTQAEEEKVTSVCADPPGLGDTLRQGWGWG